MSTRFIFSGTRNTFSYRYFFLIFSLEINLKSPFSFCLIINSAFFLYLHVDMTNSRSVTIKIVSFKKEA